jgi:hypothetical protein
MNEVKVKLYSILSLSLMMLHLSLSFDIDTRQLLLISTLLETHFVRRETQHLLVC